MTFLPTTRQPRADARTAKLATLTAFVTTGLLFATWLSRIPQYRDQLRLDPAQLGLLLLLTAAGSLPALLIVGPAINRFGSGRCVVGAAVCACAGAAVVALGYHLGVAVTGVGLFLLGFGQGGWDVSMNVQGTVVERRLGRPILSRFHAGYSVGTVVGGLLGAGLVGLDVPPDLHLLVVAAVLVVIVPFACRHFLPQRTAITDRPASTLRRAWTDRRTWLIGLLVLAFSFGEGTGNDWISLGLIDDHHLPHAIGVVGSSAFLAAITAGRWFGPAAISRFGRPRTIAALGVAGLAGVVLFVVAAHPALAFAGVALWGLGIALGFPIGISAAADDEESAPVRVSMVSSIGYAGFLVGPPFIGFLAQQSSVLIAVLTVAAALAAALPLTRVLRPPTPVPSSGGPSSGGLR